MIWPSGGQSAGNKRKKARRMAGLYGYGRRPTLPGVTPVPSARQGLTSLFGMGRGGAPALGRPMSLSTTYRYIVLCLVSYISSLVSQVCLKCLAGITAQSFRVCQSSRAISTARLCRCRLYTCGLSTSSSTTALIGSLILGWVSHLDAFSAYPFPT